MAQTPPIAADAACLRLSPDGSTTPVARAVAVERPIAIEINGIGYAVMMATPADIEDFAYGFLASERLIATGADVIEVEPLLLPAGHLLRITLAPAAAARVQDRVRHRVSDASCGLCGIENLEQALRPLPCVVADSIAQPDAIFAALARLRDHQPLNRETGAVHAAAMCDGDGGIRLVREDVGRHNAFDKLIGAMARQHIGWDRGFALLSSRCSYELVEKAALAGCPMLVTISAASDLAIARAAEAGLPLVMLARADAMLRLDAR